MNALLLAAGLGTRLKPFTFLRAKASLPLLNVPIIRFGLHYLHSQGVRDVTINLHAHPESVKSAAGSSYGDTKIHYSHEPTILGTAGAIRKASGTLGKEPFVVMNSDMVTAIPIQEALRQHIQTGASVTLVVMQGEEFDSYSGLYFEGSPPRLRGFGPADGTRYHYTGLQIVSPEVVSLIPSDQKTEIFRDIYPDLISQGKIFGFLYEGIWKEIGTLSEYLNTNRALLSDPLPPELQPAGLQQTLISHEAKVASGAKVNGSIVMSGATLTDECDAEDSIIGWDVTVTGKARRVALARGMLPWYF